MMWRRNSYPRWPVPVSRRRPPQDWRSRWRALSPRHRAIVLASLVGVLIFTGTITFALISRPDQGEHFGERVPGQRIYDHSGILTPPQITLLERHAESVEQMGVPVVVYIRFHEADRAATEDDALQLMHAWGIESSPGASDGLVLFLNLDPDDFSGDDAALVPGTKLEQAQLPPAESDRIVAAVLQSLWSNAPTATGIVQGITSSLKATERRLLLGAPPKPTPGPVSRAAASFARLPLAILSVIGLVAAGTAGCLVWRRRSPIFGLPANESARTTTVPPVLGAALAEGGITPAVLQVAISELTASGAIVPVGPTSAAHQSRTQTTAPASFRLVVRPGPSDRIGQAAWDMLAQVANDANVVSPESLAIAAHHLGPFERVVRQELETLGWWDSVAPRRRTPLLRASAGLIVASITAALIALAGQEPWGVIPTALLALGGAATWLVARSYPIVTPTGRTIAKQWRVTHQSPTPLKHDAVPG